MTMQWIHYYYNKLIGRDIYKNIITERSILEAMPTEHTAEAAGLGSGMGRRNAYEVLMTQQRKNHGECNMTFYVLLTYYGFTNSDPNCKKKLTEPPLMTIDSKGHIENGLQKFQIGEIVYTAYKRPIVINLCPFVPIDDIDERSCYSILIMHTPWPEGGESHLIHEDNTAVSQLRRIIMDKMLPEYVEPMLRKIQTSQEIRENNGRPRPDGAEEAGEGDSDDARVDNGRGDEDSDDDHNDDDNYDDNSQAQGIVQMIDSANDASIIEGIKI